MSRGGPAYRYFYIYTKLYRLIGIMTEEQPVRRKSIFPFFRKRSILGEVRDRIMQNPIIGGQLSRTRESIIKNVAQMPGNILTQETYNRLKKRFD